MPAVETRDRYMVAHSALATFSDSPVRKTRTRIGWTPMRPIHNRTKLAALKTKMPGILNTMAPAILNTKEPAILKVKARAILDSKLHAVPNAKILGYAPLST